MRPRSQLDCARPHNGINISVAIVVEGSDEQREADMALNGVLRPGYIQIRVTDIDAAVKHYVDRIGLHEVSREADGRVYLRAFDEFDRPSLVLPPADMP